MLVLAFALISCEDGEDAFWPRSSWCAGALYPPQTFSDYVLPYALGTAYTVGQGNCVAPGTGAHAVGARAAFAYDFLMPVGTPLLAARAGEVIYVEQRFADATGIGGEENTILIRHDDASIGNYGHLSRHGAFVEIGQRVAQSSVIGLSGHSGAGSDPHLHFEVLECAGASLVFEPLVSFAPSCRSIPVTFRNTRRHRHGLVEGETYVAG